MTDQRLTEETSLDLLVAALPHLRGGLRRESAEFTARLLYEHLDVDATAVVSPDEVLAFIGLGDDHHVPGGRTLTRLTEFALHEGRAVQTHDRAEIGCPHPDCPLTSAVIAPLVAGDRVVGGLKLYRAGSRPVEARDERVAYGLARVFSVYLEAAELDARAALVTQAELEALRAQISPHFLFNTLTTIAALTRTDPVRAHDLIVDFATFFRETLAHHGELVTFDDELASVRRYLGFELARYGDVLKVVEDVDAGARRAVVPVLSVQPLVENAISHGLAPRAGAGTIVIRARRYGGATHIAVSDDGVGVAEPDAAKVLERGHGSGLGLGLSNVNARLISLFGAPSALQVASTPGVGTEVRFFVPDRSTP